MFHDRNVQRSKTLLNYHAKILDQLLAPQHLPPCSSPNCARNPNYNMGSTSIRIPHIATTFYIGFKLEFTHEVGGMFNHSTKQNRTSSKV